MTKLEEFKIKTLDYLAKKLAEHDFREICGNSFLERCGKFVFFSLVA